MMIKSIIFGRTNVPNKQLEIGEKIKSSVDKKIHVMLMFTDNKENICCLWRRADEEKCI